MKLKKLFKILLILNYVKFQLFTAFFLVQWPAFTDKNSCQILFHKNSLENENYMPNINS